MSEDLATFYQQQMGELACEPVTGRVQADDALIADFENHIGETLPQDYRVFLPDFAGSYLSAMCDLREPSPCGQIVVVEKIYGFLEEGVSGSLKDASDDAEGAPVVIPIAEGGFGSQYFLILQGELKNSVYFYDAQQRWFWPDERFRSMYDNLHPDIEEFLNKRAAGELAAKPEGMENFYLVAESFRDFVEALEYWDLDEE